MGKREDRKNELRTKIIQASKVLFKEQGYETTSIEQISEKAEVGLGTAYNYFKSKEELYILSMAEDLSTDFEQTDIEYIGADTGEIVADVVIKQIKKFGYVNKKIWKTALPFMMKSMQKDESFLKEAMKIDFRFMDRIRDLLVNLQNKGKLHKSFKINIAVDLIFSLIGYQLISYVYIEKMEFKQACDNIREGVLFILRGKD